MKKTTVVFSLLMSVLALVVHGQAMTACLTMEQSQAQYNQQQAAKIRVVDTASQQMQCYYNQLATYYQQLDKDNQQKAKDAQQLAKDAQQVACGATQAAKDAALAAREKAVADREVACETACQPVVDPNPWISDGCGGWKRTVRCENWTCDAAGNMTVDSVPYNDWLRIKGECAYFFEQDYSDAKKEYKTNHSGGGDGTNPGGHGNVRGLNNPHNTH